MIYPYNAIMGRGSINKFEAAIHGLYLCMKISNPQGMITAYGNQQTTCNIEKDFVLGQRNVHCLTAKSKDFESSCLIADEKVKHNSKATTEQRRYPSTLQLPGKRS
jgi:hypothetical protein